MRYDTAVFNESMVCRERRLSREKLRNFDLGKRCSNKLNRVFTTIMEIEKMEEELKF